MLFEKSTLLAIGLDALQWAITGVVGVWVYLVGRDQVRRQSLADMENRIEARLDQIDGRMAEDASRREFIPTHRDCAIQVARITALEARADSGPSHDDLKRVHIRVDAITEAVAEMRGALARIERTIDRIDQYLMDHPHSGGSQ